MIQNMDCNRNKETEKEEEEEKEEKEEEALSDNNTQKYME
jgi:hypothetical protein